MILDVAELPTTRILTGGSTLGTFPVVKSCHDELVKLPRAALGLQRGPATLISVKKVTSDRSANRAYRIAAAHYTSDYPQRRHAVSSAGLDDATSCATDHEMARDTSCTGPRTASSRVRSPLQV